MRLESKSWHQAQLLSEHFVTLTSDMGTEMSLNQVDGVRVGDAFSYWCHLNLVPDDGLEAGDHPPDDVECVMSFAKTLYIPGRCGR